MIVKMKGGKLGEYVFTPRTGNPHLFDGKLVEMEITQRIHDGPDCYPWRKTFALFPVKTIGGKYVWLKTVYKRKFWVVWGTGFHMEPHTEAAEWFDVLKEENGNT